MSRSGLALNGYVWSRKGLTFNHVVWLLGVALYKEHNKEFLTSKGTRAVQNFPRLDYLG